VEKAAFEKSGVHLAGDLADLPVVAACHLKIKLALLWPL
jgi:hypothetical protein